MLSSRALQEDSVKLYSGPVSLFTAKVRIALAEKALPYERVEVGWSLARRYEPHHPDVVALNPKRQVPVLVDGDLVVYDSTQIFEYLEDRYPEPALYPRDVAGRARCRRLEAAADEIVFPSIWPLVTESFYPPASGQRDEAKLAQARTEIAAHHAALEKELTGRAWLCDDYSVADIATFVFLRTAAALGSPPGPEHAALHGWMERMLARPAVAAEIDGMNRFVASLR
jgi:glutathione S-transferase